MTPIAITARARVKDGRAGDYLAAFAPLLEQVNQENGTILYLVQRSHDDPQLFWTTEIYADEAAFAAHTRSRVHAAAMPAFSQVIAEAATITGELVLGRIPGGPTDASGHNQRTGQGKE